MATKKHQNAQHRFCVFCAFSWLVVAAASADVTPLYAWRQPIRDSVDAGKLYRIKVTPEIFDGCQAFPYDIRILAASNQWPYFVFVPAPVEDLQTLRVEILNKSVAEGPDRYLRVDLHLGGIGARPRHDRISINTAGSQYVRRVEVFGSDTGEDWKRMASGYLIDQKRDIQVTSRTVLYPVSDYARLQVRIYPNASDAEEEIELRGVSVAATVMSEGESETVDLAMAPANAKDVQQGASGVVLDQGSRGRPLTRLRVEPARGEFTRAVRVYGRNETTNAWRWVAEGSVFRFGDQERNTIGVNDASYRFLLLEEYHYDDPPLKIERVTAEAVPHYLVFEAGQGKDPELYYGSLHAQVPRYDLQRRTKDDRARDARLVDLGRPEPLQAPPEAAPWARWINTIAIGVVSLIVILVVVNMVRRETK